MPRSFVDPFSNGLVLSQFDLIDSWHTPILGQMPLRALGPFLHEATHFWCNNSPVGLALLAIEMRARRIAAGLVVKFRLDPDSRDVLPSEVCDTDEYWQLVDDVVRLETARRILRPVSEGLALFMEYDAFPLASSVISRPMASAGALFHGRDNQTSESSTQLALTNARLAPLAIRRKAALLMEPFACEPTGYLPGYLFLKTGYWIAAQQSRKLVDSELYVHFVKAAIYDDWDLVDVILDTSRKDMDAVNPIAVRIQERLGELLTLSNETTVDKFEQRGLAGEAESFAYKGKWLDFGLHSYPVTPCRFGGSGKERLYRVFDDLFGASVANHFLLEMDVSVLSLRDLLVLGEACFSGSVTSGNMLQFRQQPGDKWPVHAHFNNTRLSPGWTGQIDVGLYLAFRPMPALYTAYGLEQEVLSLRSVHHNEAPDHFRTPLLFRRVREPLFRASARCVKRLLNNNPVLSVTNDAIESILDNVFLPRAISAKDKDLATIIRQMKHNGFLDILEGEKDLLFALAALSSAAAVHADKKWLRHMIHDDLDDTLKQVNDQLRMVCGGRDAVVATEDRLAFSLV